MVDQPNLRIQILKTQWLKFENTLNMSTSENQASDQIKTTISKFEEYNSEIS